MNRSSIVKKIMSDLQADDIIVAATGYISREVFKYDRDLNFYMVGSMGCALGIGIGLAMHLKQRVIVINGDGSVLMSLGTLLTAKSLNLPNLIHHIIDNGCHESTGGQKTVSEYVSFHMLSTNVIVHKASKDDSIPPRINLKPKDITTRFKNAILRIKEQ